MDKTPEYITVEYKTKLNEVVAELDWTTYPAAESVFLNECESLHEDLGDDTPTGVIRRAARSNTKAHYRAIRRGYR